jgi:ketosteroid isomerase-like protein
MSDANRALVEAFYAAVDGELADKLSGDGMIELGTVLAGAVSDDFECEMVGPYESQTYEGLAGFATAWRDWITPYSSFSIEIDELQDFGDALLILVHQRGTTRRDQVTIEDASGSLWRFRDGLLCRVEFYLDRESARAAAGPR